MGRAMRNSTTLFRRHSGRCGRFIASIQANIYSEETGSECTCVAFHHRAFWVHVTPFLTFSCRQIIAHKSTTQEIIALKKVFDSIDTSRNGTVDFEEFKEGLKRSQFSEEELEQIFESIVSTHMLYAFGQLHLCLPVDSAQQDVDHSGQIQYTEFIAATLEARGYLEEERIAEAFQTMDHDGSGYIDKDKLRAILGETCTAEQAEAIIEESDKNNDGKISYDEFFDVFRDKTLILAAEVGEDLHESTEVYDELDDLEFDFDPNSGF